MERTSDILGPLQVRKAEATTNPEENQAPIPKETPIKKVVNKWPFKIATLVIDMADLAMDKEDKELSYKIISSSFLEHKDYKVDGNLIKMEQFSLSKGEFSIKAVDSKGLSCDIKVQVSVRNIGLMALIGLIILGIFILIVFGVLLRIALSKPFLGTITAQSRCNGIMQGIPRIKKRGRIYLSDFKMAPTGLDYNKSYFQATGKDYVILVTSKPVIWNGKATSNVRVQSGMDVFVTVNEKENKMIYIRFDSRMKGRVRKPGRPPVRAMR